MAAPTGVRGARPAVTGGRPAAGIAGVGPARTSQRRPPRRRRLRIYEERPTCAWGRPNGPGRLSRAGARQFMGHVYRAHSGDTRQRSAARRHAWRPVGVQAIIAALPAKPCARAAECGQPAPLVMLRKSRGRALRASVYYGCSGAEGNRTPARRRRRGGLPAQTGRRREAQMQGTKRRSAAAGCCPVPCMGPQHKRAPPLRVSMRGRAHKALERGQP